METAKSDELAGNGATTCGCCSHPTVSALIDVMVGDTMRMTTGTTNSGHHEVRGHGGGATRATGSCSSELEVEY
jgi:hypothetical protein